MKRITATNTDLLMHTMLLMRIPKGFGFTDRQLNMDKSSTTISMEIMTFARITIRVAKWMHAITPRMLYMIIIKEFTSIWEQLVD